MTRLEQLKKLKKRYAELSKEVDELQEDLWLAECEMDEILDEIDQLSGEN